jgi:hypothetical protein
MINDNLLNADGFAIDCSLADSLDSSIQKSMGISGGVSKEGNETYYNSSNYYGADATVSTSGGSAGSYVSPEMVESSIKTTTDLITALKSKPTQGGCKKPSLQESFLNRGKWATYKKCIENEKKQEQDRLNALAQAQARAEQVKKERLNQARYISGDDKILGMPRGLAIGVGVFLGLSIAGFVAYKVFKK